MSVNANGTVQSTYVVKASSDELKSISKKIIAPLRFNSAPEGNTGYKGTTVNLFLITVTSDGAIRIEQKSGQ